jgi:hypothetical protein
MTFHGSNVVFGSEQDLQSSHSCRYGDDIADLRQLIDLDRIIFLGRAAPVVSRSFPLPRPPTIVRIHFVLAQLVFDPKSI